MREGSVQFGDNCDFELYLIMYSAVVGLQMCT